MKWMILITWNGILKLAIFLTYKVDDFIGCNIECFCQTIWASNLIFHFFVLLRLIGILYHFNKAIPLKYKSTKR